MNDYVVSIIAALRAAGYTGAIAEKDFSHLPDYASGPGQKRAFYVDDAQNDFGSKTHCQRYGLIEANPICAQLPVDGGEEIAPVIGELQLFFEKINALMFASKDWHPRGMFNFASVNRGKIPYVDRVKDESGRWAVVYPDHCMANTWGAEFLPGIDGNRFHRVFFKGTSLYKDHYSVVKGNKDCVKWLRKQGVTHIDMGGLVFRICVGMAAIDLVKAGFKVRVIIDATRDLPIPAFEPVIKQMVALGIEFVMSAQVLARK
jgi:nicotinamidase/pyrazinamidase